MSRQIQDQNFLVWEVFPSGGRHGFSADPHVVFYCLTQRNLRPRHLQVGSDEAEAERLVHTSTDGELLALLQQSHEID